MSEILDKFIKTNITSARAYSVYDIEIFTRKAFDILIDDLKQRFYESTGNVLAIKDEFDVINWLPAEGCYFSNEVVHFIEEMWLKFLEETREEARIQKLRYDFLMDQQQAKFGEG